MCERSIFMFVCKRNNKSTFCTLQLTFVCESFLQSHDSVFHRASVCVSLCLCVCVCVCVLLFWCVSLSVGAWMCVCVVLRAHHTKRMKFVLDVSSLKLSSVCMCVCVCVYM